MNDEVNDITYEAIFNLFAKQHPELKQNVLDWRPAGAMRIRVFLGTGDSKIVVYNLPTQRTLVY